MTPNQPGPGGASAGFAERLLEVIDSGRRTATYKLALLIALLDLCARHSDAGGRAPRLLYTRDIAEQVAVLYWPQVIPYLVPGAGSRGGAAADHTAPVGHHRGGQHVPPRGRCGWGHLVAPGPPAAAGRLPGDAGSGRSHRRGTAAAPVAGGRLQRHHLPIPLRTQLGTAGVLLPARLRRHGPRGAAVRLLPGAGDDLLRLGPLIRPLAELHWTRMVAQINEVATAELDLHRHLFGSDRILPPKALRDGIAALQDGQCFYCGGALGAAPEADHFIPRIRCGIDAIENLVLADRRCNNDKRDLLPGPRT